MTIIVGLICRDGIILASDSQTTNGTTKRCDAKKFAIVEFLDSKALIAQAGSVLTSSRAIEVLKNLARSKSILDYRTVADLAQQAMRQVKDELRVQNCDCGMEELRDFILRHEIGCELIIAHYFGGDPYLYSVDLVLGIANRIRSHYAAIGCGANLGQFILGEHFKPGMDSKLGTVVAVYAVETVKKHDAFCGGPTRVGLIAPPDTEEDIVIFEDEVVAEFAKEIAGIDETTKEDRNMRLSEGLQSLADRRIKSLLKRYQ